MDHNPQQDQLARANEVLDRYREWLLGKPNVIGVGVGYVTEGGRQTGEVALIVIVDQKIPAAQLAPDEQLPDRLEGVRLDVQQMGPFSAGW